MTIRLPALVTQAATIRLVAAAVTIHQATIILLVVAVATIRPAATIRLAGLVEVQTRPTTTHLVADKANYSNRV